MGRGIKVRIKALMHTQVQREESSIDAINLKKEGQEQRTQSKTHYIQTLQQEPSKANT